MPPPPGLETFVPQVRFFALDEGRVPEDRLRALGQNMVAALIRLETSTTPEELAAQLGPLDAWLAPYPGLRRGFVAWFLKGRNQIHPERRSLLPSEVTARGSGTSTQGSRPGLF